MQPQTAENLQLKETRSVLKLKQIFIIQGAPLEGPFLGRILAEVPPDTL